MGKGQVPTYYVDSCVFIDLIETPPDQEPAKTIAAIIAAAAESRVRLVTSILTIGEVWHTKAEIDGKCPDPEVEKRLFQLWNPAVSPIWLVDVHELVVRDAVKLLRQGIPNGWCKTKGVDGIHLATAQRERVDEFLTTEKAMSKWSPVVGFKVCAPHYEPGEPEDNRLPFTEPPKNNGGQS